LCETGRVKQRNSIGEARLSDGRDYRDERSRFGGWVGVRTCVCVVRLGPWFPGMCRAPGPVVSSRSRLGWSSKKRVQAWL